MQTQCIPEHMEFQGLGKRKVVADFSGGEVTSDTGGLGLSLDPRRPETKVAGETSHIRVPIEPVEIFRRQNLAIDLGQIVANEKSDNDEIGIQETAFDLPHALVEIRTDGWNSEADDLEIATNEGTQALLGLHVPQRVVRHHPDAKVNESPRTTIR